jgi:hypothetical protein
VGRRKNKARLHHKWKSKEKAMSSGKSEQEQLFLDAVEFYNYFLPRQLSDWKRFFTTEERFLAAAKDWLEAKMEGVIHPRIEDDIDKGVMRRSYEPYTPSHRTDIDLDEHVPYNNDDEDDYWSAWMHGSGYSQTRNNNKWNWSSSWNLPATPKIEAPSGLAHIDLATVF